MTTAIELTAEHLGHMIRATDIHGVEHHGRLDSITLYRDPRVRVLLRIAKKKPTENGGHYWSTMFNEQAFDHGATIIVEELVPHNS